MSRLILPPSAREQLMIPDEVLVRHQLEAQLERISALRERHGWLRYFNDQLRQLDPFLELVKAAENATEPGLRPGFWHVKRNNPADIPTYYPIEDANGNFIDPHMGVLDELRKMDTSRAGWLDEMLAKRRREYESRKRREKEDRVTELAERIYHYDVPKVAFNDTKWTNSTRGKRGKKK